MKTKKKKPAVELSEYQRAIRRHIINIEKKKRPNFSVDAGAGSGKSYTLTLCVKTICRYFPEDTVLSLQFNKHIQLAMQAKLEKYPMATVKTVSSAGLMVMAHNGIRPKGRIDSSKYWQLCRAIVEINEESILADMKYEAPNDEGLAKQKKKTFVSKAIQQLYAVVSMAMNTLTNYSDIDQLTEMLEKYSVQCTCFYLLSLVKDVIETGLDAAKQGKIGFEDMTAYPIIRNLRFPQYDWVLLDEAQDLNACQLEIATRFVIDKKGKWRGRIGGFGDVFQSIMAWAGAMSDSTEQFRKKVRARVLPLSICYRCASSHLDLARLLVPNIENRPNCPEGEVIPLPQHEIPNRVKPGDYIICRTTAPLVKQCIQLIKHRIPAQVKGRDVASKLITTYEECIQLTEDTMYSVDQFIGAFKEYAEEEISRAMVKKVSSTKMQMLEDTHACIMAIASYLSDEAKATKRVIPPNEIKSEINRLFAEDVPESKVMLSTIHKAKGLEADNVFIIDFHKMPTVRKNETPTADQIQQERNCKYVALTRGKDKLYISGDGMDSLEAIRQQVLL